MEEGSVYSGWVRSYQVELRGWKGGRRMGRDSGRKERRIVT